MDKTEQFFGSNVGSENVFENVSSLDKYKTPEEVKEAIAKLRTIKTDSDVDKEFIELRITELEKYLKFLETQE